MESSSSTKRARASNQLVSCLVDGCKSDLSKCRDYHRRHKVCELHSKTARVSIGGREQRFCQQCSRFHSLGEFDEGKRSCRKRLEGHNRRRRKPQPDSLSSDGRARILAFSGSPMVPASSVVGSTWGGCVKAESSPAAAVYSQMEALRGRQFPLLHSASDRALSLLSSSSAPAAAHLHASDWSPHFQDDALHAAAAADASCSATGPHQTLSFFWE